MLGDKVSSATFGEKINKFFRRTIVDEILQIVLWTDERDTRDARCPVFPCLTVSRYVKLSDKYLTMLREISQDGRRSMLDRNDINFGSLLQHTTQ
jgi:hypothetical protein